MKLTALAKPCFALTLLFACGAAARAQDAAQLRPAGLERFESQATDSVEVTIDDRVLRLAARALSDAKPQEKAAKALLSGLRSVYVRAFGFDQDGVYQPAEVEALRSRFTGPGWSRVVGVRSKKYGDNVDVYVSSAGELVKGLAVVVAAPRQLVYVRVDGDIDLERLSELEGRFSVPRLELYRSGKE
jgi:uncharacterized protein involved in copper resistance